MNFVPFVDQFVSIGCFSSFSPRVPIFFYFISIFTKYLKSQKNIVNRLFNKCIYFFLLRLFFILTFLIFLITYRLTSKRFLILTKTIFMHIFRLKTSTRFKHFKVHIPLFIYTLLLTLSFIMLLQFFIHLNPQLLFSK